jgi:outer membrane immunogenic protein
MRKLLLGSVALVALAVGPAMAADMRPAPVYTKAPIMEPSYNWTGLYIGGHVGGGWGTSQSTTNTEFPASIAYPIGTSFSQNNETGGLGGVQGGFNYQFSNWVIGVEGDYSWANVTGNETTQSPVFAAVSETTTTKLSNLALATGRLGYAWSNWLFYVKGGGAWGNYSSSSNVLIGGALTATTSSSATRNGWTFGGGIEWGLWNALSAKVEYNHIDFGTATVTVVGLTGNIAGQSALRNTSATVDVVKVGLNYRFNWGGGMVAAKY